MYIWFTLLYIWNQYNIVNQLYARVSLVGQMVKNLPAMQEAWVWSLGQEDPLEKGMGTHSVFLPGEFNGQRILMGYSPWGPEESDTTEWLTHQHYTPITFKKKILMLKKKRKLKKLAALVPHFRETQTTVTDFIFLGFKITALSDCSHEIKRHLLLGRKAMTNVDCVLKSRDITLLINVHIVKAMVFPVVMYRCESWTIKKAGSQRIDVFSLWCWRRLLRVPWTARRSNQSILKEINPEYS